MSNPLEPTAAEVEVPDPSDKTVQEIVHREAEKQSELTGIHVDDLESPVMGKLYDVDKRKPKETLEESRKACIPDPGTERMLIDSIRMMEFPNAYIRTMVYSVAMSQVRLQPLPENRAENESDDYPEGMPANIVDAQGIVRSWFDTESSEGNIWGNARTKKYVLVDARRRLANRISDVDLSRRVSTGVPANRIGFIQWLIEFPDHDANQKPIDSPATILEIWSELRPVVLEARKRPRPQSKKVSHPDVCKVISKLGGTTAEPTWRQNCHRGWMRILSHDTETTERFFGIRRGQAFTTNQDSDSTN